MKKLLLTVGGIALFGNKFIGRPYERERKNARNGY